MGYSEATITDARLRIPADAEPAATDALRAWLSGLGYDLEVADLDAAFKLFGIALVRDEGGEVVSAEFDGVLLAETDDLFATVAPFVADESSVDWRGGRGDTWRYRFAAGRLRRLDEEG